MRRDVTMQLPIMRLVAMGGMVVLLLAGGSLVGDATQQQRDETPQTERDRERTQQEATDSPDYPNIVRGSSILDMTVENTRDERLGHVSDVAIRYDGQEGRIAYLVVGYGGVLGVGDTHVAVPWDRFRINARERLTLEATSEELAAMREFDLTGTWPRSVDGAASTEPERETDTLTTSRDAEPPVDGDPDDDVFRNGVLKGSRFIGMDVDNRAGDHLGEIEDVAVHGSDGHIAYAVVAHGGLLGIGDNYATVPLDRLEISRTDEVVLLDVSQEELERATSFEIRDEWPERATWMSN